MIERAALAAQFFLETLTREQIARLHWAVHHLREQPGFCQDRLVCIKRTRKSADTSESMMGNKNIMIIYYSQPEIGELNEVVGQEINI